MSRHLCVLASLLAANLAAAGEFAVHPVRMELGAAARTGVFTIRNEGKDRLSFQIEGVDWTQDAEGRDQYAPATDLVYFPRLVSVEPGQEVVVRVGVRQPLVQVERTFRLFIEELPPAGASAAPGTQVRVLVRFAPPIFVKPVQADARLEVERLQVATGNVELAVRNAGNQHQLVESIQLTGEDSGGKPVYATTIADRYLLAGTVRRYAAPISREQCLAASKIAVEVRTDKASARKRIDLQPSMCP